MCNEESSRLHTPVKALNSNKTIKKIPNSRDYSQYGRAIQLTENRNDTTGTCWSSTQPSGECQKSLVLLSRSSESNQTSVMMKKITEGQRLIIETSGNLLQDDAQTLVNAVNTVGVMGKGIALQFKRAFPDMFAAYSAACSNGLVQPGHVFPVQINGSDRWVLNFPTKRHWREESRIDDIVAGLNDLAQLLVKLNIQSVAIPPLGCGNGGLHWPQIRPLILEKLDHLDIDIRLYEPTNPTEIAQPTMKEFVERARKLVQAGGGASHEDIMAVIREGRDR